MKLMLVCKNNANFVDELTIGKTYECLSLHGYYLVFTDQGNKTHFFKNRFYTIEESRNLKLNKLLNNE